MNMKKNKIATIDDFYNITEINNYFMRLSNNTIVTGIKIEPKDLINMDSQTAASTINRIKNALGGIKKTIYHQTVFVPNDFDELQGSLIKKYNDDSANLQVKLAIESQLDKIEQFKHSQYRMEFFMLIVTDEKNAQKDLEMLVDKMSLGMDIQPLQKEDYKNYQIFMFDLPRNYYAFANEFEVGE